MGKLGLLAIFMVAALSAGAAFAKDKAEGAPKDKMICTVDRESKSRIPKKVCRSRSDLELRSAQDDLDDAVSKLRNAGRSY